MRTGVKSSRRGLLAGLRVAATDSGRYYLKLGRTAMACQFEVFLRPEDRRFVPAVHEALDEVDRLEAQMSVYRDSSELSALNRSAFAGPVSVEKRLYDLFRLARRIGGETGGAFDITAGPLIRAWGIFERRGRVPDSEALERARAVTGWDKLDVDDGTREVRFRSDGMELNLASIGKGYALDRAAALLREAGVRSFLLHAGHSSVIAAGDSHAAPGWEIGIRDPAAHDREIGSVRLIDGALSTSGSSEHSFRHIIDPRTGEPSPNTGLVSVAAAEAARAEALSTAFFVMGRDEVRRYCEAHPEIGTILAAAPDGSRMTDLPVTWGISLERSEVWR
jgi:thiamine biosynthesis lipoprotein